MAANFPKEIFVTREEPERDDPYVSVYESVEDLDWNGPGKKVAVYRLERVATLKVDASIK